MSNQLQIFSVKDSKAELFIQPFHSPTIATGLRSFSGACANESSEFAQHADDYTLFHLGSFDQTTGMITMNDTPKSLGLASEFTSKE